MRKLAALLLLCAACSAPASSVTVEPPATTTDAPTTTEAPTTTTVEATTTVDVTVPDVPEDEWFDYGPTSTYLTTTTFGFPDVDYSGHVFPPDCSATELYWTWSDDTPPLPIGGTECDLLNMGATELFPNATKAPPPLLGEAAP